MAIELRRETYPGQLNVAFTRGFVVLAGVRGPLRVGRPDLDAAAGERRRGAGLRADPPEGGEGTRLDGLRGAAGDPRRCSTRRSPTTRQRSASIAYDLNEPEVVSRLEEARQAARGSSSTTATLTASPVRPRRRRQASSPIPPGDDNVKRQHMGNLQHNKTIVVDGPKVQDRRLCGSTNFSWRGFYVQNNNALVLRGATAVAAFHAAFDAYWHATAEGLRRHGLGELDGPRPAGHRRPGRVLAALRLERPARDRSPTTSASTRPRRCSSRWRSSTRRPAPILDAIKKVTSDATTSSSTASPTGRSAASICSKPGRQRRAGLPVRSCGKDVPEPF